MRITTVAGKSAYITAGFAVLVLTALAVNDWVGPTRAAAVSVAIWFAFVALAARIFRGPREGADSVRPWWQMTAEPSSGFVLAGLFLLNAVLHATEIFIGRGALGAAVIVLGHGAIGAAYLNSSLRLRRLQRPDTAASPQGT